MVPCTNCQRSRSKHDQRLIAQGLVECKPSENPRVVMSAFWMFADHHACTEPFAIKASGLHIEAAWPLQFHPEAIAECGGYLPKSETDMKAITE